jgi:signal transduction histidine kinase
MRGVEDSEDREDFEAIAAAAHEMSAVITTLLEVARASLDRAHEQSCTVAEVVAGLVSPVDGGMAVEDRTGSSTAHVAAPRDLVVRAVAPLVDNALRHARARVLLTAADHADHVELVVADDGAGVDPSLRDRVFEPGASGGSDGAGLGLGIARRVARSFGGDVRLDPDATGAVFVVTLPRR